MQPFPWLVTANTRSMVGIRRWISLDNEWTPFSCSDHWGPILVTIDWEWCWLQWFNQKQFSATWSVVYSVCEQEVICKVPTQVWRETCRRQWQHSLSVSSCFWWCHIWLQGVMLFCTHQCIITGSVFVAVCSICHTCQVTAASGVHWKRGHVSDVYLHNYHVSLYRLWTCRPNNIRLNIQEPHFGTLLNSTMER